MEIEEGKADGIELRKHYPNSFFMDDIFDKYIIEVNEDGAIVYSYYDLLYGILDENKDGFPGFPGEDYEKSKEDFDDDFQDYYDRIDGELLSNFSELRQNYKDDNTAEIPPRLKFYNADVEGYADEDDE
jgi:hypothetical protein